jgi:hypothetical protein
MNKEEKRKGEREQKRGGTHEQGKEGGREGGREDVLGVSVTSRRDAAGALDLAPCPSVEIIND